MNSGEGKVVCVTGASGFIASSLIHLLLQNGYTVRATVRDPARVDYLKAFPGAEQRLSLFQADLIEQGSFDEAVRGCHGVFHTASPVLFGDIKDPQAELIRPAVDGTLNVLSSCLKSPSIKRVILTSSLAAVLVNDEVIGSEGVVVDETCYSDLAFCEKIKAWYCVSKTLAEKAAWDFAKSNGIDLVVINPGLVIGRCLQPTLNYTFNYFISLITQGNSTTGAFGFINPVDVKDAVRAHVLAFENPSAKGRYCLAATTMYHWEVVKILRGLYPTLCLPESDEEEIKGGKVIKVSKEKAKSLGIISYIPIHQTLQDTIQMLKEKNLLVL
ncbi:phenylacetaldehyde reductase-like [Andrographis paniculata]|uniref:phenylacetaldehyde reductase-like n=1 Tax=Andrographis paniculata TaxID=175694 RepID=UPI0021E7899C|nr:phenylacetaldehyde reductase-like [Andrographis paniculata]